MQLLALSDVTCWSGKQALVRRTDPDAVLLGGDLVDDGNFDPGAYGLHEANALQRHVEGFYRFLEGVGGERPVWIVRGNHDLPEKGFDVDRVTAKPNVELIEGQIRQVGDVAVAGVGYLPADGRDRAVERARTEADVVLSHAPRDLWPEMAQARPSVVLQGHRDVGRYRCGDTLFLLTRKAEHAIVEAHGPELQGRMFNADGGRLLRRETQVAALDPAYG